MCSVIEMCVNTYAQSHQSCNQQESVTCKAQHVIPWEVFVLTSASFHSNKRTTSRLPACIATCNGVSLSSLNSFTFFPSLIRSDTCDVLTAEQSMDCLFGSACVPGGKKP